MNCNNYVETIICSHFLFCPNLSWEVYLHWDSPLLVFSLSFLWFFSLEKWSNDHCVFLHNDEHEKKLHDIERDIPNKWRWEWLETKVLIPNPVSKFPKLNSTHGPLSMALKDHIRKFDIPETAICILCSVDIEYTQGGLGTIKQHV